MPEDFVEIGRIRSVNPAKRELRVTVAEDSSGALDAADFVEIERAGETPVRCKVEEVTHHGTEAVVALSAGVSRDLVRQWKGATVLGPSAGAATPGESDPYAADPATYVGYKVYTAAGDFVGEVVDAFRTPAQGVLEIGRPGGPATGKTVLVPLVPEIVTIETDASRLAIPTIELFDVDEDDAPGTELA